MQTLRQGELKEEQEDWFNWAKHKIKWFDPFSKVQDEFLDEEDIYLPMYKEDITNENRVSWSLWEKWPGNMKDFQYLAADTYTSLDQIEPIDFIQYFKDLHPGKNIEEISKRIEEMRELVNNEMWKLIYLVD